MNIFCGKCNQEKPDTEFYFHKPKNRGLRNLETYPRKGKRRNHADAWCKLCKQEYDAARRVVLNKNPEYVASEKERKTQLYLSNFPKHWASRQASRAKKAGSSGYVSWEEWQELLKEHDNKCHWCSCELHVSFLTLDHVAPLAQGGKHERDNVVPACANCNHKRKWEGSVKYHELYKT